MIGARDPGDHGGRADVEARGDGNERVTAKIQCPGCGGEDVEALMQPFIAKTTKKS